MTISPEPAVVHVMKGKPFPARAVHAITPMVIVALSVPDVMI
jgi:hypothetical protein